MSFSDFEDLKMGKTDIQEYLTPFYVTQRNNQDILMPNHNPRIQKYTGFSQLHLAQKAVFKPSETLTFDFGLHYTTTSNIPRYDRLVVQNSDNSLKYAEWDYGPQQWLLANFQVTKLSSRSNFYDKIKTTLAYQFFGESRISRKFESVSRKSRAEKVRALSLNLDFDKSLTNKTNLSYGAEYIYNKVGSEAASINIDNNSIESIATRYPDGSEWSSLAAYLSFKYKPIDKLTLQSGIRYNSILINADLSSNAQFYELPFSDASLNTSALTGTAGLTWEQSKTFLWKLNATTAFRAPNIDDIGKVFDSQPGMVVAPNPHLSPEHAYGGELGLTINIDDSVLLDFSTYYTYLHNVMARDNFSINGVSDIVYDEELSEIQAIQNNSEAWVTGFEAGLRARLSKALEITSQFSVSNGRQKNAQNIDSPMRHVAPAFGDMHVIWKHNKITLDGYINYNAGLSYEDISHELSKHLFALDENGNPYAPSWLTFNLRTQYNFSKTVSFVGAIENISNKGYRPFASGISGPGTNLIFAITYQN